MLQSAGYPAELFERGEDRETAFIEVETETGFSSIRFVDCDEAIQDLCETLVLSSWWDRNTPISDKAIAVANRQHRYVSVFRATDGDPVMQWAILTRTEGIPSSVFLEMLSRFSAVSGDFAEVAFEGDEEAADTAAVEAETE